MKLYFLLGRKRTSLVHWNVAACLCFYQASICLNNFLFCYLSSDELSAGTSSRGLFNTYLNEVHWTLQAFFLVNFFNCGSNWKSCESKIKMLHILKIIKLILQLIYRNAVAKFFSAIINYCIKLLGFF